MILDNTRKELLHLRKDLLHFQYNVKKIKLETIKFRYSLKELSAITLIVAYISFMLVPLFANINWFIAFLKGSSVSLTVGAVAGTGALATVAVINVYPILNRQNDNVVIKQSVKQELVQEPLKKIEVPHVVNKPIIKKETPCKNTNNFTPKEATVILINGNELRGLICKYTETEILMEGHSKTINLKDIYKIEW